MKKLLIGLLTSLAILGVATPALAEYNSWGESADDVHLHQWVVQQDGSYTKVFIDVSLPSCHEGYLAGYLEVDYKSAGGGYMTGKQINVSYEDDYNGWLNVKSNDPLELGDKGIITVYNYTYCFNPYGSDYGHSNGAWQTDSNINTNPEPNKPSTKPSTKPTPPPSPPKNTDDVCINTDIIDFCLDLDEI